MSKHNRERRTARRAIPKAPPSPKVNPYPSARHYHTIEPARIRNRYGAPLPIRENVESPGYPVMAVAPIK